MFSKIGQWISNRSAAVKAGALAVGGTVLTSSAYAVGAVDADLQATGDDFVAGFDYVKGIKVSIVVFAIVIGLLKMLKR